MTTATETNDTTRGEETMTMTHEKTSPARELRDQAAPILERMAAIREGIARALRDDPYLAGTDWAHRLTHISGATIETKSAITALVGERERLRIQAATLARQAERRAESASVVARKRAAAERSMLEADGMDPSHQSRAAALAMRGNAPDLVTQARSAIAAGDAVGAQVLAHAAVLAGAGRAPVSDLSRGITVLLDKTNPRFRSVAESEAMATREAGEAKQEARRVAELAIVLGRDPETPHPQQTTEVMDASGPDVRIGKAVPTAEAMLAAWSR